MKYDEKRAARVGAKRLRQKEDQKRAKKELSYFEYEDQDGDRLLDEDNIKDD